MKVSINLPLLAAMVFLSLHLLAKAETMAERGFVGFICNMYIHAYSCSAVIVMKGCYSDLGFQRKGRNYHRSHNAGIGFQKCVDGRDQCSVRAIIDTATRVKTNGGEQERV